MDERGAAAPAGESSPGGERSVEYTALTWRDEAKVAEYVGRIDRIAARLEGERALVDALPDAVGSVLDLGCGDGRLLALVAESRGPLRRGVGLDNSPPMLDRARARFAEVDAVAVHEHDMRASLPEIGPFDVAVSGFAIHHLAHERKRSLFAEVAHALRPGGVFVNLEVVQCATPELHEEFNQRIGRPGGDPEDQLAGVDEQLTLLRDAGFVHVDCNWRWRGFAVLVGRTPDTSSKAGA